MRHEVTGHTDHLAVFSEDLETREFCLGQCVLDYRNEDSRYRMTITRQNWTLMVH